jgi:hypothetical protein
MKVTKINLTYLYKVKDYTIYSIKKYPEKKNLIEDEYYKLLIKIAEDKLGVNDFSDYYKKVESML